MERVLLSSFDSATERPRSAIALSVPTRQADQTRVCDWPAASPENENVPTNVTVTTNGPAAAFPMLLTVKLVSPRAETTRSASGWATVHAYAAGAPTLPA